MSNIWLNKEARKREQAKKKLTREIVIAQKIAADINLWLREEGQDIHRYRTVLDRVADIYFVVRESTEKANKLCDQEGIT